MASPAPDAKLLAASPATAGPLTAPLSRAPADLPQAPPRTERSCRPEGGVAADVSTPPEQPTGDQASLADAASPRLGNGAPPADAAATGFRLVVGPRGKAVAVPVAGPAVILDEKGRNVPHRGQYGFGSLGKPRLGKRHYRARQQIRDRLRCWQREGLALWWMTLTSSPESPPDRLRRDFQAWRKRLARHLEVDVTAVQYVMVDTAEGHGVLHFLCALPPGTDWLSYNQLRAWWEEIHGAKQCRFVPLRKGDGTARRLSHYMVSQYMVSQGERQDLLGRISGSRMVLPLAALRRQVLALFVSPGQRSQRLRDLVLAEHAGVAPADDDTFRELIRRATSACWNAFRDGWGHLLQRSWLDAPTGERWVLMPGMTAIELL